MRWLRFKIWLVEKLGGETYDLADELSWTHHAPGTSWPKGHGRIVDMDERIALLDPDTSSFSTMLTALKSTETTVSWLEDTCFVQLAALTLDAPFWSDWQWAE